jgi:hypothetical protein
MPFLTEQAQPRAMKCLLRGRVISSQWPTHTPDDRQVAVFGMVLAMALTILMIMADRDLAHSNSNQFNC